MILSKSYKVTESCTFISFLGKKLFRVKVKRKAKSLLPRIGLKHSYEKVHENVSSEDFCIFGNGFSIKKKTQQKNIKSIVYSTVQNLL